MSDDFLIELRDLSIGYGRKRLVESIRLKVIRGDFLGLAGPNGSGKSTLLKTLLRLLPPLEGSVVSSPKLRIGYVPQRSRIDPIYPLSALEIVRQGAMGKGSFGIGFRPSTVKEGMSALERLGVSALGQRPYRELSGGQQQRVLIARALVRAPDLLVLDEPTDGLDLPSERQILDVISALAKEGRLTVILAVHNLSILAERATFAAFIDKEKNLFVTGAAESIITSEKLSTIYDTAVSVERREGTVTVRAAAKSPSEVTL